MRLEELSLGKELIDLMQEKGIRELYPPQELAVKEGLLDGKSLVISSPTASGKTLIAIIASYRKVKKEGKKVVYLTPLRALAYEKYSEFKELGKLGIRTSISTGDYDSSGENLGSADIIITTNERFDSIMRHRASWLGNVGLYIADEVHLAGSDTRGPTLEMILTKITSSNYNGQIIALSATINNGEEISRWLGSKLVEVSWRPVPLIEGVYEYGKITYSDGRERNVKQSGLGACVDLSYDTVLEGGQALVFAGTRRRAVSLATKISGSLQRLINDEDKRYLRSAAREIRESSEETTLSNYLSRCIINGCAFHHAGLAPEHRRIVEDYFRRGYIKVLTATPTLAAGVNLPARRVIVADITRYDPELGISEEIPVLEYKQMAGRAGRPQYDDHGETIIVVPHSASKEAIVQKYINGRPENIVSRLGDLSCFRVHVLATISSSAGVRINDVEEIFSKTLLALQTRKEKISKLVESSINYLLSNDLVKKKDSIVYATEFGKRVSMLYIDPLTGVIFRDAVSKLDASTNQTVGILHTIISTPDFEPKFPLREKDYEQAISFYEEHKDEMLSVRRSSFIEFDNMLRDMRSVMVLYAWIDEWKEEKIMNVLGAEPGDLYRAKESADWLLYSLGEIAKLFNRKDALSKIEVLRKRIQSGVSEELLELTMLEGVGRVRARALYSAGFKTIEDIKESSVERLAMVGKIGQNIARKIKEQVTNDRL